jgi:hypothetical protein
LNFLLTVGAALFFAGFLFFAALPYIYRLPRIPDPVKWEAEQRPVTLDIIIPAYLEASTIGPRVSTLKSQVGLWRGLTRIVVVASDEATFAAAEAADEVILTAARGKPLAVNLALASSTADYVLLTDANCEFSPANWPEIAQKAIREGWDLLSASKIDLGGGEGAFHALEKFAKRSSNSVRPSISVVGEFLLLKRENFQDIPGTTVCDDVWVASNFLERGLNVGVLTGVDTLEPATAGVEQLERRVRIASGLMSEQLPRVKSLMTSAVGRQFCYQKLARISLGALAFWASVTLATLAWVPLSLFLPPLLALGVVVYLASLDLPRWLSLPVAAIGMQIVPPMALARSVRRRRLEKRGVVKTGWKKVPR